MTAMLCLKKSPKYTVLQTLATLEELFEKEKVSAIRKWLWNGIEWIKIDYREEIEREKKAIFSRMEEIE